MKRDKHRGRLQRWSKTWRYDRWKSFHAAVRLDWETLCSDENAATKERSAFIPFLPKLRTVPVRRSPKFRRWSSRLMRRGSSCYASGSSTELSTCSTDIADWPEDRERLDRTSGMVLCDRSESISTGSVHIRLDRYGAGGPSGECTMNKKQSSQLRLAGKAALG